MRDGYYDRDGKHITRDKWSELIEDYAYKKVATTTLPWGGWASTVWLGLDHRFNDGEPLIFETMIFTNEDYDALDVARYSTLADAIEGHHMMVERWQNKEGKEVSLT